MPDEKVNQDKTMTREDAYGMIEDIVGTKMSEIAEQRRAEQSDFAKDLAVALKNQGGTQPKPKLTKEQRAEKFAIMLGSLASAGINNLDAAAEIARAAGDEQVAKALGTTTIAQGSAMIEPEFAEEMIELLRADQVVLQSGARTVPMESGILSFGRVGTGATAAYRGESEPATVSSPTLEELELRARILDVLCPASNQLLNRTAGKGAMFVQEELVNAVTDKSDATWIRGDATQNKPKGLLYWAKSISGQTFNESNIAGTTGDSTLAEVVFDLGKMMRTLMTNNIKAGQSLGWLFSPRTWHRLFTQLDSNGNYVFRAELNAGVLNGIPFKMTTNIPENLTAAAGSGGGSDASEVYLAAFFHVLIGETEALRISASNEASYTTGGTTYSAFQRGETVFKVEVEHDLACRHGGKEVVVLESVTWGN
jgi:HK97 family phage major capsid protein